MSESRGETARLDLLIELTISSAEAILCTLPTPEARVDFIYKLTNGWCEHCGRFIGKDGICHCINDD